MTTKPALRYTAQIQDEPTSDLDAQTVFAQAGRWTLARVGATDLLYSATHVQFDVHADDAKRRVIITLAPADTYSVEIGQIQRRTYAWISRHVERDVHAEDLSAAIERAYVAGFGG